MKQNLRLFSEGQVKMKLRCHLLTGILFLLDNGVSGVGSDRESVSVNDGDSVTLNTGLQTSQQEEIKWYFNDTRIAQISGDLSKICSDVQCNEGTERFRDRLKLDHQTGSLTIMNIRTTDSGEYKLKIIRGSKNSDKTFSVSVHVLVPVMEEDSVTLNTAVNRILQDRISYYFNDTRIAQINGDLWKSCTDVQCNEGTERFRDRLKLDNQTGSLTIMNITNTDSGLYELKISSSSRDSEKTFNVSVHGVSAAERDEMKRKSVMEGESVTFDPGKAREPNDVMTWYFNDTLIAEITGDQSKICTDVQCEERFRDRLKLNHLNGSLTITNSRNTDSGEYKLLINSSRFSISRSFSVSVTDVPDSGSSPGTAAAITVVVVVVVVVLLFIAVGVIYCRRRRGREQGSRTLGNDQDTGVPLQPI